MFDILIAKAKRKHTDEWVSGYLSFSPTISDYIIDDVNNDEYNIPIYNASVGLNTTFKDKNKKRIFSGDIVNIINKSNNPELAIVKYGLYSFNTTGADKTEMGFYLDWLNKGLCYRIDIGYWFNNANVEVEVIGNIYDNDIQIDKDVYINKYQALSLFEKYSYPVKYDGNSIEKGMTITGIRQVINELSSVNNLAQKVMGNISELEIYCPNCNGINIYEITHDNKFIEYSYCPNCGQKLDWSDMK